MSTPSSGEVGFDEFVRGMEPHLKELLAQYRIPVEDAEDVLQQTLLALLYHWDRVHDPEDWLLTRLQLDCTGYWHRRGKPVGME